MPRDAAAALARDVMQADFSDVLPRIGAPTLCIGGKQSHIGSDVMPYMARCIPDAQLVMLDTRHFVHLEQPLAFNEAVRTFFNSLAAS